MHARLRRMNGPRPQECPSDDGEVVFVGCVHGEGQRFPHARKDCRVHRFNIFNDQKNEEHCPMCCCYVCGVPADQCPSWEEHCHIEDDESGKHIRLCFQNPFYRRMVSMAVKRDATSVTLPVKEDELDIYRRRSLAVYKVERGFRLYKAGERKHSGTSNEHWYHDFKSVRVFFKEQVEATDVNCKDDKDMFLKCILLDALTETVLRRTWRGPEHFPVSVRWDRNARIGYSGLCNALMSNWLLMRCVLGNSMAFLLHERFNFYGEIAKEKDIFANSSKDLVGLMQPKVSLAGCLSAMHFVKVTLGRWDHYVKSVRTHDEIDVLGRISKENGLLYECLLQVLDSKLPDRSFMRKMSYLRCVANFRQQKTIEAWDAFFLGDHFAVDLREAKVDAILKIFFFRESCNRFTYMVGRTADAMLKALTKRFELVVHVLGQVLDMAAGQSLRPGAHFHLMQTANSCARAMQCVLMFLTEQLRDKVSYSIASVRRSFLCVCAAVRAFMLTLHRFPVHSYALAFFDEQKPILLEYLERLEGWTREDDDDSLFTVIKSRLIAIYDDEACGPYRLCLSELSGGDAFRLSKRTRRLRRRLKA